MKKQYLKLIITIAGVLIAGICYSCSRGEMELLSPVSEIAADPLQQTLLALETDELLETRVESYAYVYICGEVHNPGVYEMMVGSRIFEVVEQAGGFTEQAAKKQVNLAQTISDGMNIVILSEEEAAVAELFDNDALASNFEYKQQKINLNTASKEQLMTLRGIGESRAEDIIRYREEHGSFKKIEDIMQISGIKQAAFDKIKDDISV